MEPIEIREYPFLAENLSDESYEMLVQRLKTYSDEIVDMGDQTFYFFKRTWPQRSQPSIVRVHESKRRVELTDKISPRMWIDVLGPSIIDCVRDLETEEFNLRLQNYLPPFPEV